jgi:hypothetical protein
MDDLDEYLDDDADDAHAAQLDDYTAAPVAAPPPARRASLLDRALGRHAKASTALQLEAPPPRKRFSMFSAPRVAPEAYTSSAAPAVGTSPAAISPATMLTSSASTGQLPRRGAARKLSIRDDFTRAIRMVRLAAFDPRLRAKDSG